MGIGRREFLAVFGACLAKLATGPSPAAAHVDDLYINRRFGLAFTRPPGWDFIELAPMGKLAQGQLLALSDPQTSAELLESLDPPFVALAPTTNPDDEVSPAIQFYLSSPPPQVDIVSMLLHQAFGKEYPGNPDAELPVPLQIIRADRQASRGLLHAMRVNSLPESTTLSECPAAEYTYSYQFHHQNLPAPRPVRVRSMAIEHHERYYLLRLIDTPEHPVDFESFLSSVRLV